MQCTIFPFLWLPAWHIHHPFSLVASLYQPHPFIPSAKYAMPHFPLSLVASLAYSSSVFFGCQLIATPLFSFPIPHFPLCNMEHIHYHPIPTHFHPFSLVANIFITITITIPSLRNLQSAHPFSLVANIFMHIPFLWLPTYS